MRYNLLLAGLLATSAEPAIAVPTNSLQEDAVAFGAREAAGQVDLSPSGTKLLMLVPTTGAGTQAKVYDLATMQSTIALSTSGHPDSLRDCRFVTEDRLVCEYDGVGNMSNIKLGYSRHVSVKIDGSEVKALGKTAMSGTDAFVQDDGSVIDWNPGRADSVLMSRVYVPHDQIGSNVSQRKSGLGVDRLDIVSLRDEPQETPRDTATDYMSDGHGNVRVMEITEKRGQAGQDTGKFNYLYRPSGKSGWAHLGSYDVHDQSGIIPMEVDADTNSVYVLRKFNGRRALYRIMLDGTLSEKMVGSNDTVDVDEVITVGRGRHVVGYSYATDRRHAVYFDSAVAAMAGALAKVLPSGSSINFAGTTADSGKYLMIAASDINPGHVYVFDKNKKALNDLALIRPELEKWVLSPVKAISYKSADGTMIPAYLTMPVGVRGTVPAVVLPHGGPSSRDEWGFDWLAQFLAARGYAVLQPQYRGSSGYGQDWRNVNAFRNWRTAIDDIDAGARYLSSSGVSDSSHVAIIGWSYGGYAALQAAAVDPSLYKAVVAIAPVTDLGLLKFDTSFFSNGDLTSDFVGSGRNAANGSPLRNAAAISAPVLLVHGTDDLNVNILHSQKMADALRGAGKNVDLITFDGLDHQLADSNARAQMLVRVGTLLDQQIGH